MTLYDWSGVPAEQLNPHISRKSIHLENMTIARLEVRKDAVVPEHSHLHEQVSFIESGALKFFIGGREQIVRGGEFLAIRPHEPHSVVALEDTVVTDLFAPVRSDWARGDDAYLRR